MYVKTSTTAWTSIKSAYVKTSTTTWQKWFSSTIDTPVNTVLPSITAPTYANTNIPGNQALLGSTLTSSKGTWTEPYGTGTNSYAYSWLSNGTSTGSTGTTFSTTGYDGQNITFSVTATDTSGTTTANSTAIEVTKNMPVNISSSISLNTGGSTSSPHVGDILSISSSWNTGATYLPDSYTATFITASGTYNYSWAYGSGNPQNSYTIQASDVGHPISCYVTAYNTGAPTVGVTTATQATGNVTISVPVNTSAPYWTDTSNNPISAPYYVGSTYRLHFGTWSNSPTYYEYQVYLNNQNGQSIQQDVSGNYQSNYVDITFSFGTSYTIGTSIYAGNSGGLGNPASAPSIGPITYQAPTVNSYPTISGSGRAGTNLYYNAGSYNLASSVRTDLVPVTNVTNFSGLTYAESTASVTLTSTVNTSPLPGNGSLQYTVVVPSTTGIVAGITQVSGSYITSGSYVTAINGTTLTLNQHTGYTTSGGPLSEVLTFTNAYYTINTNDATYPAFNYATRDTVVGLNGSTYYYWSGADSAHGYLTTGSTTVTINNGSGSILSYLPSMPIPPTYGTLTSTSDGFTASVNNSPNPSGGTYSGSASSGTLSINSSTGAITVTGLSSGGNSTVTVTYSVSGYISSTIYVTGSAITAPGAFTYYAYDSTNTPHWPSGAGISISGASNNVMTISWNAATYATDYKDQVSGVYNSSLYDRATNLSDTWSYSSSGYESGTVYAYNTSQQVTLTWGASSNAVSYFYAYSLGSTLYSGTTTLTSITFSVPASTSVTLTGVSAWSGPNATGAGTGGTLQNGYSSTVTPSAKSTSATSSSFYLTYTAPSYTVTFSDSVDSAGGSTTGSTVTLPTPSSVANYTFNGWYTASSGGTRVGGGGGSYSPTSNITLYAQWTYTAPKPSITSVYATGGASNPFITFYAYGTNLGSITGTIYRSSTLGGTYTGSAFTAPGTQVGTGNGGANYYYYAVLTPWTGASGTGTSGTPITTSKTKASSDSFTQVY